MGAARLPSFGTRISLVREFGRVGGGSSGERDFPSPRARSARNVSAPPKALARIVPFSFYPVPRVRSRRDVAVCSRFSLALSGAGARTLAKRLESRGEHGSGAGSRGRGRGSASVRTRERRFLEILYLKRLSLLGELFDSPAVGGEAGGPPEFRPSVDRAWVASGPRNLLPRYCNFRGTVLDIGRYGEEDASRPGAPGRDDLSFLGVAWFEALLVNAKQDGVAVRGACPNVSGSLQGEASPFPGRTGSGPPSSREPLLRTRGEPFVRRNGVVGPLSRRLVDSSRRRRRETGNGRETITAEIRALRARVRDRLFGRGAAGAWEGQTQKPSLPRAAAKPEPGPRG